MKTVADARRERLNIMCLITSAECDKLKAQTCITLMRGIGNGLSYTKEAIESYEETLVAETEYIRDLNAKLNADFTPDGKFSVEYMWGEFLDSRFGCRANEITGNRPCDGGLACDACTTTQASVDFKAYYKQYLKSTQCDATFKVYLVSGEIKREEWSGFEDDCYEHIGSLKDIGRINSHGDYVDDNGFTWTVSVEEA